MSFNRRQLIQGFGTVLALPWLESASFAAGVSPAGAPTSPPLRTAFIYLPNGMHMSHWTPRGASETDFETSEIFEPVKQYKNQTTVITGLNLQNAKPGGDGGGDHARSVASFLTGARARKTKGSNIYLGKSVDQVASAAIGDQTRFASLELGTESSAQAGRCDSGYSCAYTSNISWRTPTSPMAKEMNPAAVFKRLFGSADDLENQQAEAERISRRKSILDFVLPQAKSFQKKLAAGDRRKFDEYLFAVRDIEKRLGKIDKLDEPECDVSNFERPLGVPASYGEHVKLMFDMMTLAFQTDSTRIISFMYANAGSNRSYRDIGIRGGHHDISHHGNSFAKQKKISQINVFHMSLMTHLLDRLSGVEEAGGTLLDNCMLLYGSGISDGNRHNHNNLPIALFGGAGKRIETGRHIRVRAGTPLTNLYCSMLDRMGVNVDSFSDSNGRVDELGGQF
jgi:hypothetical protein